MDEYVKRLYYDSAEVYVQQTIIAQKRTHVDEENRNAMSVIVSNRQKANCLPQEKNYIPILIKVNEGVTQWVLFEIEIKKKVI